MTNRELSDQLAALPADRDPDTWDVTVKVPIELLNAVRFALWDPSSQFGKVTPSSQLPTPEEWAGMTDEERRRVDPRFWRRPANGGTP